MVAAGRTLLATLALAVLAACGGAESTPEAEVRALLAEMERASRERDLPALRNAVSAVYRDASGRTTEDIHNVLRVQYLRQRAVYLLTRIESLDFPEPGRADLVVLGAMAGQPLDAEDAWESLRKVRADVYRFELTLAREDDDAWRVVSATWRPASLDDVLNATPLAGGG